MIEISVIEVILFMFLYVYERTLPARKFSYSGKWVYHWLMIVLFGSVWLYGLLSIWSELPVVWEGVAKMSFWNAVLLSYLVYSFVAYWYHRLRHSQSFLWHYVHYMHHAPSHMDTRVTFWRHPVEIVLDSLVIMAIGIVLNASVEVIFCVLIIESMLEIFHHSNIHTPKKLRWLGYILQLPEQHLIHHQSGLHRWNYGTVTLWDTIFRTVRIPEKWNGRVGLPQWNDTLRLLFYRY